MDLRVLQNSPPVDGDDPSPPRCPRKIPDRARRTRHPGAEKESRIKPEMPEPAPLA